jgi:hypothetical protein
MKYSLIVFGLLVQSALAIRGNRDRLQRGRINVLSRSEKKLSDEEMDAMEAIPLVRRRAET